jgi:hypothetical protein
MICNSSIDTRIKVQTYHRSIMRVRSSSIKINRRQPTLMYTLRMIMMCLRTILLKEVSIIQTNRMNQLN